MKKVLTIIFLSFFPYVLHAASTTVYPFQLQFYVLENRFRVEPKIILSCRYEKMVVGDSSEYYTKSQVFDLDMEQEKSGTNVFYRVALKNKKYLEVNGAFKPTKECMSELKFTFTDNNFAIGWAGQKKRPIVFSVKSNNYFKGGDTSPDFSEVVEMLDLKNLDFLYVSVPGLQVNIWMTGNDKKLPLSPISSAINPETNMPYLLEL